MQIRPDHTRSVRPGPSTKAHAIHDELSMRRELSADSAEFAREESKNLMQQINLAEEEEEDHPDLDVYDDVSGAPLGGLSVTTSQQ